MECINIYNYIHLALVFLPDRALSCRALRTEPQCIHYRYYEPRQIQLLILSLVLAILNLQPSGREYIDSYKQEYSHVELGACRCIIRYELQFYTI